MPGGGVALVRASLILAKLKADNEDQRVVPFNTALQAMADSVVVLEDYDIELYDEPVFSDS